MLILTRPGSAETDVRGSRFLSETFAVESQEAARALLKSQKEKYRDATHVVHAFVIGPSGGILGCSDDGEPSGTAGRPALEVLKGSGITNVMLTVTRWFGGALLGTGGLVKAYTESAKAALSACALAELVATRDFSLSISYDVHDRVMRELHHLGVSVTGEEFGTAVEMRGQVREADCPRLADLISDLTSGRGALKIGE